MAIVKCTECLGNVSTTAKACPHCGAKVAHTSMGTLIGAGIVIFIAVSCVAAIQQNRVSEQEANIDRAQQETARKEAERKRVAALTPEQRATEEKSRLERDRQAKATEEKRKAQAAKEDAQLVRASLIATAMKKSMRDLASYRLESVIAPDTGALCFEYRSKNGFGAYTPGQVVASRDGRDVKSNDMGGFVALWNRECGGKKGRDITAIVQQTL